MNESTKLSFLPFYFQSTPRKKKIVYFLVKKKKNYCRQSCFVCYFYDFKKMYPVAVFLQQTSLYKPYEQELKTKHIKSLYFFKNLKFF